MKRNFVVFALFATALLPLVSLANETMEEVVTIEEDQQVIVLELDPNGDGDIENISLDENVDGEIIVLDEYVIFIPDESFDGEATITYEVCVDDVCSEETTDIEEVDETEEYLILGDTETVLEEIEEGEEVEITDDPEHGDLEVVDGELIYTPDDDYEGIDIVAYDVCEGDSCVSSLLVFYVKKKPGGGSTSSSRVTGTNVCGDGKLNMLKKEQCDDGNLTNGDGCSDVCTIEKSMQTKIDKAVVSQKAKTTGVKKIIDINAVIKPYLNANENVLLEYVTNYVSKKSVNTQVALYQRIIDKLPQWVYTKFKMNRQLIHIVLKAKIDQLNK